MYEKSPQCVGATKSRNVSLTWIHMTWGGVVLRQDGAVWLRIISGPPPDPQNTPAPQIGEALVQVCVKRNLKGSKWDPRRSKK